MAPRQPWGFHHEWPSSTPEFNALDDSIWSILEAKACAKTHKTVGSLKRALIKAWEEIRLKTLRKVIDDFPKRLNARNETQTFLMKK
uniref:Transposase n=1 Tax=Acrobeloides nanus TaxID=290746 RepID=A0A914CV16_9BILA